jgi:hypothetical protein
VLFRGVLVLSENSAWLFYVVVPNDFLWARIFLPGIIKCAVNVWHRMWRGYPRGSTMKVFFIIDKVCKYLSVKNRNPPRAMISSYNYLLKGMLRFFLPFILTKVIRYLVTWERMEFHSFAPASP